MKDPAVSKPVRSAGPSTRKRPLPLPFILETSPQCKKRMMYKPMGTTPVTASRDAIHTITTVKEMPSETGAIKAERKQVVLVDCLQKKKRGAVKLEDKEEVKEKNEAVEEEDELEEKEEKPAEDAIDPDETVDGFVLMYSS